MNTPNFHVIKVYYIGATNSKPSRVKLVSERFKVSKTIEYNHQFNGICDIALDWLSKNGFNIIGKAEGKDCYYIISDTFNSIIANS